MRRVGSAVRRPWGRGLLAAWLLVQLGAPAVLAAPRDDFRRRPHPSPERTVLRAHHDRARVIVKFAEGTDARLREGHIRGLAPDERRTLRTLWKEFGIRRGAIRRVFARSEAELDDARQRARARRGRAVADLNLYYRVALPPGADAARLCDALNDLPFVELAEPMAQPPPPPVDLNPETPDYRLRQGYSGPAPPGVADTLLDAVPGADGTGVALVDVEYSWVLDHEDLELDPSVNIDAATPADPFPADEGSHGTAVLGMIGALDNEYGVSGLVPAAALYVAPANTLEHGYDVARAIDLATSVLEPGDVILVEQQAPACDASFGPAEWTAAVFDAIQVASELGIIVVEAAGNGGIDLDDPSCLGLFDRAQRDSGALIVGAGSPVSRARLAFSSYGSRLDLQGWGSGVTTTGFGELFDPADPRQRYTGSFSGTSSAAALVAGTVIALQGASLAAGRPPLLPEEVRALLTSTGISQDPADRPTHPIGPLPDLPAALAELGIEPKPPAEYFIEPAEFAWVDATLGEELGLRADDGSAELAIGFPFRFYGEVHTTVRVSSNGYMTFGEDADAFSNAALPTLAPPNGIIAPYWDDLDLSGSGSVHVLREGEAPARRVTIEWHDVPYYGETGATTFQVTLFERRGRMRFQYLDVSDGDADHASGASASVGIEDTSGSWGLAHSVDAPSLTDGQSFFIRRTGNRRCGLVGLEILAPVGVLGWRLRRRASGNGH